MHGEVDVLPAADKKRDFGRSASMISRTARERHDGWNSGIARASQAMRCNAMKK